ncbi:MAG: hypothetical protein QGH59_09690 [Gemmatimonadota bacterium]|jgi:hypothetical protein|nr:hypothetical protein [Gemmatimonadota bacterium]|tara:strand:- start:111 stop:602 length:492 start_codon:yes stop_codon:yes gene_type:complete
MKKILAVLACVLIASSAIAQTKLATGGSATLLAREGGLERADGLFVELEHQTPLDQYGEKWLGVVVAYDGDNFGGGGLRYYRQAGESAIYPGFGLGAYAVSGQHEELAATTLFAGAELLLEVPIPVGDGDIPLTVFGGIYPAWSGDDVTMVRIGARFAADLVE